jgi:hypothetical protein
MRSGALFLTLLVAAGCASQGSKQREAAQTAASWAAASEMTLRHWADGHVTAPFARKALERADDDLEKTRKDVAPYAAAAVDAVRQQLAAALADVERNDRNRATERAGALAGIAAELRHAAGEDRP